MIQEERKEKYYKNICVCVKFIIYDIYVYFSLTHICILRI